MGTGVTGRRALLPVEMETRRERGRVVMPAQPQSPELVICPTAQVKFWYSKESFNGSFVSAKVVVFHLVFHLSLGIHLSKGIEDAFKTAATEVSLLAGTDEFNATELFGVGEILPTLVLLKTIPHSDFPTLSQNLNLAALFVQHFAFLMLRLHTHYCTEMKMCRAGRAQHAATHSFSFCVSVLNQLS